MLRELDLAPPDPILGLNEAFRTDARDSKVNLGVGVYQDASGQTPVLASVREAERRLVERGDTKAYLPISGLAAYGEHVQRLLFGAVDASARTAQTPGGTGALRVAADLLAQTRGKKTIWLPTPTWANHGKIFAAAGHQVATYPYFEASRKGLDEDGMVAALRTIPAADVVVLHGCCHNPTGFDPTPAAWRSISDAAASRGWLPLFDLAYQGFGEGLDEDVGPLRAMKDAVPDLLVASSFSKNFGLYSERAGALTVHTESSEVADRVFSHVKVAIRSNYSNPPRHASAIVATVLDDDGLAAQWRTELEEMRTRISSMRAALAAQLKDSGRDFSFLQAQRGMFGFTGLSPEQVDRLRSEHAIYLVRSGRINVAGLNPNNIDRVGAAIRAVLG